MKYVVSLAEYYDSGYWLVFGTNSLLEAEHYAMYLAMSRADDYLCYVHDVSEKPKLLCSYAAFKDYKIWLDEIRVVLKYIEREEF